MVRSKKVRLVASIALAVVLASGSAAFGAFSVGGLKTYVPTISGNVVNVVVVNTSTTPLVGTVEVSAVVNGVTVTGSANAALGGLQSGVVSIPLPAAPSRVISCGIVQDGTSPI